MKIEEKEEREEREEREGRLEVRLYTLALETNRCNLEGEFSPSESEPQECCSYQTVGSKKNALKKTN